MGLISSKNKNNTFNPKELNRKQLQQQNLIFIVIAIIIIIALIGVVGYFINFVVAQMNLIFQSAKETNVNLEGFDLKGFNEIKEKIKITGEELEKLLEEVNKNATTTAPLVNEEVSSSTVSTSTPAEIKEGSSGTSTLEINQSATSTPTATPSKPTIKPTPTATISPSATPKSTPSPTPTNSPSPTAASPTPSPTPTS
jgi:hypothetical protein